MKKTEVMFFFDTEDFTSERSAEAIKREAEICTSEGVTGHFAVVGLLAQQLRTWGRQDILDALKPHIIGTHTYGHTLHPDICEASDCADFNEAFNNVAEYEDMALELLRDVLSPERILFACPPGNSKSYASMYYYADRGLPFYCDTVVYDGKGTALHYCNQEHIDYGQCMESLYIEDVMNTDDFIEKLYATRDRAIVYTHPNIAVKTEFWDVLNYDKTNLREFGDWIEADDRDPAQTEKFYRGVKELMHKLQNDDRFIVTNLNEILSRRKPRVPLKRAMLPDIRVKLKDDFAPIREPSYSVSDIFYAVVRMLNGEDEYLPSTVYGFLSKPYGVAEACTVTSDGLRRAAASIKTDTFIPEKVSVDDLDIGSADFLFAALDLLIDGGNEIKIMPKEQLVSMEDFKALQAFHLKGTWRHSDDFNDDYLSDRLRLQCWTLRYE